MMPAAPVLPKAKPLTEKPSSVESSKQTKPSAATPTGDTFPCPHCSGMIADEPELAGREVGCPHCNGRVIMPGAVVVQPVESAQLQGGSTGTAPLDFLESSSSTSGPSRPMPVSYRHHPKTKSQTPWLKIAGGIIATIMVLSAAARAFKEVNHGGGGGSLATSSAPPGARRLGVHVGTAVDVPYYIHHCCNPSLHSVECYGLSDRIIITFDVDTTSWEKMALMFPLLVRLFDRNGQHLTHFQTSEVFVPHADIFQLYSERWEQLRSAGMPDTKLHKPVLLKAKGNRLEYVVNTRDMQSVEKVEIGFLGMPD